LNSVSNRIAREDEFVLPLDLWIEGEARIAPEHSDITSKLEFVSYGIDSADVIDEETHAHDGRPIPIGRFCDAGRACGGRGFCGGGEFCNGILIRFARCKRSEGSVIHLRAGGGRLRFRWSVSTAPSATR